MTQQVLSPQEKANKLVLLCLTMNPDLNEAKDMAKKIAKNMTHTPDYIKEYISDVAKHIDSI
jgi:hypothetical protein